MIPAFIGVTVLTFALIHLIPGDPAEIILRDRYETPGEAQIRALRLELAS